MFETHFMIFTNCTVPYSFSKDTFDHYQSKRSISLIYHELLEKSVSNEKNENLTICNVNKKTHLN